MYEAFVAYREAKAVADLTGRYRDAENAAAAWVRFINTYLPANSKLVPMTRRVQ
jgi:hypothetical protein